MGREIGTPGPDGPERKRPEDTPVFSRAELRMHAEEFDLYAKHAERQLTNDVLPGGSAWRCGRRRRRPRTWPGT